MSSKVSVYHLHYNIERRVLSFPSDKDIGIKFDEKYTLEMYHKELEKHLNLENKGRVHLTTGKASVDTIQKKATDELKKLLMDAFYGVCLPDVSVMQNQNQNQSQNAPVDETTATTITVSTDEAGYPKWNWKFRATDSDSNNTTTNHGLLPDGSDCRLECTGTVFVQCEELDKMLDNHVLRFKMKRSVQTFGDDCYTDCYGQDELEGAEEHFSEEFRYNYSGEKIIGYNLQEVEEINDKASSMLQKMFEEDLSSFDDALEIRQVANADVSKKIVQSKPLVFKNMDPNGFASWVWNFAAVEEEYGCTLKCQGSVDILKKQSLNPNIPQVTKKRKLQSATKAAARPRIMRTNILYS